MTESGISVLVLTKNEEMDLPGCLASVAWCNDVHVLDSFSTDRTAEIARSHGATLTQRTFDGYASQRNAGLHELKYKHSWVLVLDADERIPAPCADELHRFVASSPATTVAARLRRRDFWMGTWLQHAQISPYFIRLVRPERVRYEREINEVLVVDGEIADLAQPFDHFPFSKGLGHWIEKHNKYSSMEAAIAIAAKRGQPDFSWRAALLSGDFNERRKHQKQLFYRLPMRPLVKWLYMVLVRRAFLDGRAGLTYALLQAMYEYMIVLKQGEIENKDPL